MKKQMKFLGAVALGALTCASTADAMFARFGGSLRARAALRSTALFSGLRRYATTAAEQIPEAEIVSQKPAATGGLFGSLRNKLRMLATGAVVGAGVGAGVAYQNKETLVAAQDAAKDAFAKSTSTWGGYWNATKAFFGNLFNAKTVAARAEGKRAAEEARRLQEAKRIADLEQQIEEAKTRTEQESVLAQVLREQLKETQGQLQEAERARNLARVRAQKLEKQFGDDPVYRAELQRTIDEQNQHGFWQKWSYKPQESPEVKAVKLEIAKQKILVKMAKSGPAYIAELEKLIVLNNELRKLADRDMQVQYDLSRAQMRLCKDNDDYCKRSDFAHRARIFNAEIGRCHDNMAEAALANEKAEKNIQKEQKRLNKLQAKLDELEKDEGK